MLPHRIYGTGGPLYVCLHWLGGSARTWTELGQELAAAGITLAAIDLPGFGDAAAIAGYTPQESAAAVIETIRAIRAARGDSDSSSTAWLLGGHSMGGKIATLVARAAVDGAPGLEHLAGMIMTSPSPPEPEPMKNSRRDELLATMGYSSGDPAEDRRLAEKMIDGGIGKLPVTAIVRTRSVEDVLRLNRAALRAWLEHGSRADLSEQIGVLPLPALIFAGDSERALGPETQQKVMLPHFRSGKLLVLEGMGHHAPIERPAEVAAHIVEFVQSLGFRLEPVVRVLTAGFLRVLASSRTSPQTRSVMTARVAAPATSAAQVFSPEQQHTLQALIQTVIPEAASNLAARLQDQLATSKGDGWRYDVLPNDCEAWHKGLASIDAAAHRAYGIAFLALPGELRHALLQQAADGRLAPGVLPQHLSSALHAGESADVFSAGQMQRWFEDVRAELTRLYVSDPRTLDRIGYTGFADDPEGFTQIRLDDQHGAPEELSAQETGHGLHGGVAAREEVAAP